MQVPERAALEKRLAYEFASLLPPQTYQNWMACRHTTRHVVYYDSIFVLWQAFLGSPMIVGAMRVTDIRASFQDGIELLLEVKDQTSSFEVWVGHAPKDVLGTGRVFAHVPYKPDVTFLERVEAGPYVLRVPIVFRTQGNPNDMQESELQVSPVGGFRAAFPQFKEIRL